MKVQFNHEAVTSFTLWFDNHLINKGEGFSDHETQLYYVEDNRLPDGVFRYSSPYKQWVYGYGIPEIYKSEILLNKNDPDYGYWIDYENGGIVFFGSSASNNLNITAKYKVKDFNVYNTNLYEDDLIVEKKFETNSRFNQTLQAISPYDQVLPAVFINSETIENKGFAFGGQSETTIMFKSVVMAENMYQLDGISSIFADTHTVHFPLIGFDDHPINEKGDLKDESFSYQSKLAEKSPFFMIDRVVTAKVGEGVRQQISPSIYLGFLDFEVISVRFLQQS